MTANFYKYSANMNDRTYFTSVVTTTAGADKRYFSDIEADIYFGDMEMTDLYQFEFGIDEKILPVYGYNCYYASELVSGQRIVQGQFVVNYTDSKLIQNTLSSINNSVYTEITAATYKPGGDLHHAIYDKQFDIMIGYGYYNVKDLETYNATSQTIIGAKITGMRKVLDTTGQPILEVYSFVAKDFIEENITQVNPGSTKSSSSTLNTSSVGKESIVSNDTHDTKRKTENEAKAKKDSQLIHVQHTISYDSSTKVITLGVSIGGKHTNAKLVYCNQITVKKIDGTTIPSFNGPAHSQLIFRQNLTNATKYSSLFDKTKKTQKTLACEVEYEINVDGKKYTIRDYGATMELR